MVIAKFGGSSLSDASGYKRVAEIVRENNIPVVIVSAPGGKQKVTDLLIEAYGQWEKSGKCDSQAYKRAFGRLNAIARSFNIDLSYKLASIEADVNAGGGYDYTLSRGEYLSAWILSRILGYNFVDARECVKLTLDGKIDFESIVAHKGAIKLPCVIPGFYGKLPNGKVKLLARGGSDISGAAIAAALGGEYQKWTDVDGIFDGHGGVIERLSYDEAELLCYFGASVMQYQSMQLLKKCGVSLTVKNTFSASRGTLVSNNGIRGYAFSSKKMFLAGDEAASREAEIVSEGLNVAMRFSLLGKSKILIDGGGFSPLAIRRILGKFNAREVTATAVIGNAPRDMGELVFSADGGRIYLTDILT